MPHPHPKPGEPERVVVHPRSPTGSGMDDESLMLAVENGEPHAANELLRRHWAAVVGYAARYTDGRDGAEDIAQEMFLRVWQRTITWKRRGTLRAFLFGVARNLARNEGRRWREVPIAVVDEAAGADLASASPAERATEKELQERFLEALHALPPRRQEVFTLARVHGLSYQEIAEVMEISPQTVANQMSAALATLRRTLGPLLGP